MMKKRKKTGRILSAAIPVLLTLTLFGCSRTAKAPDEFTAADSAVRIFPDYTQVTIPPNIAPMNFRIDEAGDRFITVISGSRSDERISRAGKTVEIPEKEWHALLEANRGGEIHLDIYAQKDGGWQKWPTVVNPVADEPIDSWVSYRLIEPGYEIYQRITLNQRNLESFDERPFIDNAAVTTRTCLNCHHFQNRSGDNFLFHNRGDFGGTNLIRHGEIKRLDTKRPDGNAAVYPAWHPTLPFIAFSTNYTRQAFHSRSTNRIEVHDHFSDLLLYDIDANEMITAFKTREIFETFPSWSPDGTSLYYCSAELPANLIETDKETGDEFIDTKHCDKFKYNIRRIPFDAEKRQFGPPETVVDAAAKDKSAVHPRISPDGRFLLYTIFNYGTFPIWHRESDLKMIDLTNGAELSTDKINSAEAESWHTWDSSGHWIVFSSRRGDSLYTRLYFAHVAGDGTFGKPFLLPQKNPEENTYRLKSYNIPEMMVSPINIPASRLARAIRFMKPEKVKMVDQK